MTQLTEPRPAGFDELDLALIDALQTRPRAPWALLGTALGISATTAARRWTRLSESGLAWLTAYAASEVTTIAYVEIDCLPTQVQTIAAELARRGWVVSVDHVCGSCDLLVTVSALDLTVLAECVARDIGALPGVTNVRIRLAVQVFQEGSHWRAGSLDGPQRAALSNDEACSGRDSLVLGDIPLLRVVGEDGRISYAGIANRLGVTEHSARRRLYRLCDAGLLVFRCDFAHQLAGWPVTATYRASVPPAQLESAAASLRGYPDIRLCAAVTGDANLFLMVWLRSVPDSHRMEAQLARAVPALRVVDRAISLTPVKRMGRLLDTSGRAIGHVPMATAVRT